MAEPLTLLAGVVTFSGGAAVSGLLGNEAHRLFRQWLETATDPATGLPRNHDLNRASRESLRGAVQVLLLELAGRLDPDRGWLTKLVERGRWTGSLARPVFAGHRPPAQQWLDAFRAAVAGPAFDAFHNQLHLSDDQVSECFREGEVCAALGPALADGLLAWARGTVRAGNEPRDFEPLVRQGWTVRPDDSRPITLAHAYCLCFREHLKADPKVFNTFTADSLNALRTRLEQQGAQAAAELADLRAAVQKLAAQPPVFSQFEAWLTPQLGELQALLTGVRNQLDALARGQGELKAQQGEILVAVVTLAIEVQRGNEAAKTELYELRTWLDGQFQRLHKRLEDQHADQIAGHDLTHESLVSLHGKVDGLKAPARHVPFDPLHLMQQTRIRTGALIGRDALRDDLADRLRRGEDACVYGPGGFGKTALAADALRVAIGDTREDLARSPFPDGLVFLDLYQLKADAERAWTFLADRFAPGENPTLPPRERAGRACADRRALVVVEGAEEARDGATLQALLDVLGTPMRRLVLTRNPAQDFTGRGLRLDAELPPDAARALLRKLSPALGTDAQLTEIVTLLGGHPLALTNAGCQLANPDDTVAALLADLRAAPLDRNVEPGNERHPLRWTYDRSWRLISDGARQVLAGLGLLGYAPVSLGAAEAALMADAGHPREALRGLVRFGFLARPEGADPRWRFSHALAYRYAAEVPAFRRRRGDESPSSSRPLSAAEEKEQSLLTSAPTDELLLRLAGWVVADFTAALAPFRQRGEAVVRDPRPVDDVLVHVRALLAGDADPAGPVARRLLAVQDALPQPGQTVVLRARLAELLGLLHQKLQSVLKSGPEADRGELARLANSFAVFLSEVGRRADALAPAQEAVELRRALARANPDAFTPDLAGSLNNLATFLSEVGRRADALAPAQEAVELYRALARANPDAFTPDWARSLHNLANRLSAVGRRADALAPAQEAVELYRALARANPDAFTPDWAGSLGMMGQVREANGELEAALGCFREGVEALTPAFAQLPEAFAPLIRQLAAGYLRVLAALGREPDDAGAEAFLAPVAEGLQRLAAAAPPDPGGAG